MRASTTLPYSSSKVCGAARPRAPRAVAYSNASSALVTPMARSVTPSPCAATCAPRLVPARTGPRSTNLASPDSST